MREYSIRMCCVCMCLMAVCSHRDSVKQVQGTGRGPHKNDTPHRHTCTHVLYMQQICVQTETVHVHVHVYMCTYNVHVQAHVYTQGGWLAGSWNTWVYIRRGRALSLEVYSSVCVKNK